MANGQSTSLARYSGLLVSLLAGSLLVAACVNTAAAQSSPRLNPHTAPEVQIATATPPTQQPTSTPPPQTNIRNQTSAIQVVPTNTPPPQTNVNSQPAIVQPPPNPNQNLHVTSTPAPVRDVALTVPDYLQPGDHELDFPTTNQVQAEQWVGHTTTDLDPGAIVDVILDPAATLTIGCDIYYINDSPGSIAVGWAQKLGDDINGGNPGCTSVVGQAGVRFDISKLVNNTPKFVTSAHLTFSESPGKWTDGQGNQRSVAGCVSGIGIANTDFVASPPIFGTLFSYDLYDDVTPSATQDFDVTQPVQDWFSPSSPRYGFILKGSIEDLQNDDASSCLSSISNMTLHVNYSVI